MTFSKLVMARDFWFKRFNRRQLRRFVVHCRPPEYSRIYPHRGDIILETIFVRPHFAARDDFRNCLVREAA
jgi:hypothetical protein